MIHKDVRILKEREISNGAKNKISDTSSEKSGAKVESLKLFATNNEVNTINSGLFFKPYLQILVLDRPFLRFF